VILLQCLSFGQVAAAPLVRSWSGAGAGVGRSALSRASGLARSLAGRVHARAAQVVPALARTRSEPGDVKDDAN